MYNDRTNVSARIALEICSTGAPTEIIVPQACNTLRTALKEVITSMLAVVDSKGGIKQTLADIWWNYVDANGKLLG